MKKNRIERKIVKLSDIKMDQSNPNVMNKTQKEALKKSIDKFGYIQQIIVDKKTMQVADGEHRLRTLLDEGVEEAEITLYDFENDTDRRIFRQIANKLHGEHDESKDVMEFRKILEKANMELVTELTAISEQEILNMMDRADKENKDLLNSAQEVNQLGSLECICPKCKHKFKRKQ